MKPLLIIIFVLVPLLIISVSLVANADLASRVQNVLTLAIACLFTGIAVAVFDKSK